MATLALPRMTSETRPFIPFVRPDIGEAGIEAVSRSLRPDAVRLTR